MRAAPFVLVTTLCAMHAAAPAAEPGSFVATRRVNVTFAFSGEQVFLYGQAPAGTTRVVAAMEGPAASALRLLQKGRVALFWLGVRQYRLGGVPGLYLVNANCPLCNRPSGCTHAPAESDWNRILAPAGITAGRSALRAAAELECMSGTLAPGEVDTVLDGFWELQARRGLFAVHASAVRLGTTGAYYHRFDLPAQAPDGRYLIATYFLSQDGVIAIERNELFVRKSGLIATLSQLAERRAATYGAVTVLIALAAGWLAGALFKRGGGH